MSISKLYACFTDLKLIHLDLFEVQIINPHTLITLVKHMEKTKPINQTSNGSIVAGIRLAVGPGLFFCDIGSGSTKFLGPPLVNTMTRNKMAMQQLMAGIYYPNNNSFRPHLSCRMHTLKQ